MRALLRPLLLMGLVLLVPVLPFLLFGPQIERWIEQWSQQPGSRETTALLIVGLLSTDILLPVPSSLISTLGGWQLGAWLGTLASWIGMTLGAALGFVLARRWGTPFALRLTRPEQLQQTMLLSDRFGPLLLILARGVPVLAEASVLLMGIHRLAWRRFLPPVMLSNFGIALAYSAFGQYAQEHQWLPLALGVSVALPVLLATIVSRVMNRRSSHSKKPGDDEKARIRDIEARGKSE